MPVLLSLLAVVPITDWHDYSMGVAGSAAALMGLLTVAVSLGLNTIIAYPQLPNKALGCIIMLLTTLLVALFCLAPGQSVAVVVGGGGTGRRFSELGQHVVAGLPLPARSSPGIPAFVLAQRCLHASGDASLFGGWSGIIDRKHVWPLLDNDCNGQFLLQSHAGCVDITR